MKKRFLFGLSVLTALTGMQVPAADAVPSDTLPADSAFSAADALSADPSLPVSDLPVPAPVLPDIGTGTGAVSSDTFSLDFRTGSDPIQIAHQIRSQIEAAAMQILREEQVESLHEAMNQTQFLLTGESELLLDEQPEIETEFTEETESEFPEETESETPAWPVEMEAGEDETQQRPRHGVLAVPELQNVNIARINLYDYRMLRAYPLPSLPKDLHRLYDMVKELVSGFDGEWSVYVQNLSTNQALVLNDKALNSASVMKLYIMETVYEAFDDGSMTRDEDMVYLLRSMIINSSNDSSNRLLTILGDGDLAAGIARVNDFIQRHGYTAETAIHNGFQDPAATLDPNSPNMVRAKDVGLLLSRIYNRQFISRKVCNEIEQMMLEQGTRFKIPRGVPDGVDVGNKSGETSDTANDAAFVYSTSVDYILVVLSHGWSDENAANENVVKVSRLVYDFFEN